MSLKSNPNSIRAKIRFESNQNPIGQHWNVIQILLKSYWSKLTSHLNLTNQFLDNYLKFKLQNFLLAPMAPDYKSLFKKTPKSSDYEDLKRLWIPSLDQWGRLQIKAQMFTSSGPNVGKNLGQIWIIKYYYKTGRLLLKMYYSILSWSIDDGDNFNENNDRNNNRK